jgi:hypothetical protein
VHIERSCGEGIDAHYAQVGGANAAVGNSADYNDWLNNPIEQTPGLNLLQTKSEARAGSPRLKNTLVGVARAERICNLLESNY